MKAREEDSLPVSDALPSLGGAGVGSGTRVNSEGAAHISWAMVESRLAAMQLGSEDVIWRWLVSCRGGRSLETTAAISTIYTPQADVLESSRSMCCVGHDPLVEAFLSEPDGSLIQTQRQSVSETLDGFPFNSCPE